MTAKGIAMDKREGKIYRLGISGSYGGMNLGDEAILQSIIARVRQTMAAEITVFSRNPEDTLHRHDVEKTVPVRNLLRNEVQPEIATLDLFILGGGGILFDGEAEIFLREVLLAHELGVPVMVYAVSAGPLRQRSVKEMVRAALNPAAAVTVRDREAKRLLEDIGVDREIMVTADPALLMQPEPIDRHPNLKEELANGRRLIGMSVREPGPAAPDIDISTYHDLLANAADYMVDRFNADVVFIPMERRMMDMQHSHAVISKMLRPQHASVIKKEYSAGQVLWLMKHLDFAVGMRLHFLIFAALQNIPFVPLPYSTKVLGFLDEFEMEIPPIQLVNAGRLIAHIDQVWDSKESLRSRIKRFLPGLQRRAMETNDIVLKILEGVYQRPAKQHPLFEPA
jgi:polysaccharide pyruvyl transferase CsaB